MERFYINNPCNNETMWFLFFIISSKEANTSGYDIKWKTYFVTHHFCWINIWQPTRFRLSLVRAYISTKPCVVYYKVRNYLIQFIKKNRWPSSVLKISITLKNDLANYSHLTKDKTKSHLSWIEKKFNHAFCEGQCQNNSLWKQCKLK